jgi:hypothetical protein
MDDLFEDFPIYESEDGKLCSKCGIRKPETEFRIIGRNDYRRTECDSCLKENEQLRRDLYKQHEKPGDDYQCPICERLVKDIPFANRSPLVLDHCHDTKTFRGWICDYCNRGLGAFGDDLGRLQNAINYLRGHYDKEEG